MITEIGTDIAKAKDFLERGELVAIPTETVYGLAGNGLDEHAILKIYHAKNRPKFNPLILHVANVEQAKKLVKGIPEKINILMDTFSPGPITFLLPKSEIVPDLATAGSDLVAIRIPDHVLTRQLLSELDFPLAAPSANPSGYVSPVLPEHVLQGLDGKIPYILDGGPCKVGLESTIVGVDGDTLVIHRLGTITSEDIRVATGATVTTALSHSSPTAPGQLKSHYATTIPLLIGDIPSLALVHHSKKLGILSFKTRYEVGAAMQIILSESGSMEEAAAGLFKAMRELDGSNVDLILTEKFPEEGIGMAINDRLSRAAYRED
ncbi:MAG: L-threonylcarbamoyladenylate synthase [bacterium]|jgi:L-threonylcarbamoyladenylate synthase